MPPEAGWPQYRQLRRQGFRIVSALLLREIDGLLAGDAGPAGGGDCRYRFGVQQLLPHGAGADDPAKRGVSGAGDIPMPFPTVSLCEPLLFPTSMHYRNLATLDTEAMVTAQPLAIGPRQGGATRARCLRRSRCPGRGIPLFNRIERIPPVRVSKGISTAIPWFDISRS